MSRSRIELASIPSLIFYKDSITASRRTKPLPQLVCRGAPCKLYTPDVVHCKNLGGSGIDVDWKCEADLPDALRFGRVEVSCEGWSKPGDPYVLKGSCSLEYRLVHIPDQLQPNPSPHSLKSYSYSPSEIIFWTVWIGFLAVILYNLFFSCFRRGRGSQTAAPSGPSSTDSYDWFPGGINYHQAPPPSYKDATREGWRPGFWTGAMLGGLANHIFSRRRESESLRPTTWDWERPRGSILDRNRWSTESPMDDRGEGTSSLGTMRRSSGFGGSSTR